ncbi:lysozyme family protein [Enterococcus mundtii]|nr:lysozyme family protein [Enterococcus mundtii]
MRFESNQEKKTNQIKKDFKLNVYKKLYFSRHQKTEKQLSSKKKNFSYRSSKSLKQLKTAKIAASKNNSKRINKPIDQKKIKKSKIKITDRLNSYQGYVGYTGIDINSVQSKNGKFTSDSSETKINASKIRIKGMKDGIRATKRKPISGANIKGQKLKKLASKKIDAALLKHVSPKNKIRNKVKKVIIDKVGRDENGDLNLLGLILAIVLLVPVLFVMIKIVLVASVVITIISIFLAIWSFIMSIFTIKTEDMALEEAYRLVTQLDAQKNREVTRLYSQLKVNEENDEVYFVVNGVNSNPDTFTFNSNGDTYLYFLNAKYENYDITKRARTMLGYRRVTDEIQGIHKYTFNWGVEYEHQMKQETVVVENEESGEMEEIQQSREFQIAIIRVTLKTIDEYLENYPKEMNEEERDKFLPIQDLDRFENKVFLENPLGKDIYGTVIEKYGYRGRDPSVRHYGMVLKANQDAPVYAAGDAKVITVRDNLIVMNTNLNMQLTYRNLKNIRVKEGQRVSTGDFVGEAAGDLDIRVAERRWFLFVEITPVYIYPAAYIDNLVFSYPESTGYHDVGGGITGSLISPPETILQWEEEVKKACKKYNISGYENVILSIIWEETGGLPVKIGAGENGYVKISRDIMQSSESLGLPPNSIETEEESIDAGVKYFSEGLNLVEEYNLDKRVAIQAYNYGHAFIKWLVESELDYNFDVAKIFSREKSKGATVSYRNPVATRLGYTWRYVYGNMFYVPLVTSHIMTDTGDLIKIAKDELGTPNGDKYWRWFGLVNRVEWCAIFVSWVANEAGYLEEDRIPRSASCLEMIRWFTARDKYRLTTEGYIPKEGDLVFFDWNGGRTGKDHVGIVEYSDGRIVQTIEGNSGNMVRRQTYVLDSPAISGYGITRSSSISY